MDFKFFAGIDFRDSTIYDKNFCRGKWFFQIGMEAQSLFSKEFFFAGINLRGFYLVNIFAGTNFRGLSKNRKKYEN